MFYSLSGVILAQPFMRPLSLSPVQTPNNKHNRREREKKERKKEEERGKKSYFDKQQ